MDDEYITFRLNGSETTLSVSELMERLGLSREQTLAAIDTIEAINTRKED